MYKLPPLFLKKTVTHFKTTHMKHFYRLLALSAFFIGLNLAALAKDRQKTHFGLNNLTPGNITA